MTLTLNTLNTCTTVRLTDTQRTLNIGCIFKTDDAFFAAYAQPERTHRIFIGYFDSVSECVDAILAAPELRHVIPSTVIDDAIIPF